MCKGRHRSNLLRLHPQHFSLALIVSSLSTTALLQRCYLLIWLLAVVGPDGMPAEVLKHSDCHLQMFLVELSMKIWDEETGPGAFKHALIVYV
jgi:hypothetical protein